MPTDDMPTDDLSPGIPGESPAGERAGAARPVAEPSAGGRAGGESSAGGRAGGESSAGGRAAGEPQGAISLGVDSTDMEPGEPDGLERLWTPWRMAYVASGDPSAEPSGCPFCVAPVHDVHGLVVARGAETYAILNRFPYNPGHLLICPYRHVADYTDLTDSEAMEVAAFTQMAMRVVRNVSGAHGFNIGLNQGGVAGAGVAGHLHQHVVPRWGGDANFMPVIGRTKTLPQLLSDTRDLLAASWPG